MTSKVFISYRRDDSAGYAGRLHDRLAAEFGRDQIVMDVDSFDLGVNFVTALREEVGKCEVLLAVIGSNWVNARDNKGDRRLDNPNDFVRAEVAAALQRNIRVIPILLDGAKIPQPDHLPEDLRELALRNALDVRHTSFNADVAKLVRALKAPFHQYNTRADEERAKREAEANERAEQERLKREEETRQQRGVRTNRRRAELAVVLVILGGLVAAISWQWPNIVGVKSAQPTPTTPLPPTAPQTATPPTSPLAQQAALYEAAPNDPQGKRFPGSVVWRTVTISPGPGLAPELAVRADLTIPDRQMTVTWTLRRNTDKALPASHTIDILFNLPPDFPGGDIDNVQGILMKESEKMRGVPLAGLVVKVTKGFFLFGLNSAEADMQRNIQLLKEREWFDNLIVYTKGGRAILTMEKGPAGDRAFSDAFSVWDKSAAVAHEK